MSQPEPHGDRDAPRVVVLCGSMRFADTFARLERELALAGHVVLAPVTLEPGTALDDDQRAALGRAHLRKVELADEVLVVDVGGYVGEQTRREIAHARERGVAVRFLEASDHPVD